jgi:hypothetical protein
MPIEFLRQIELFRKALENRRFQCRISKSHRPM